MTAVTLALAPEKRLLRRPSILADRRACLALVVLSLMLAMALAAPLLHSPTAQDASARLLSPSRDHLFGTDELRRDLFSRTINGLRTSVLMSAIAVVVGALLGTTVGFVAGYAGGLVESMAMRLIDAWLAFPALLTAMAILTILGPGTTSVAFALAIFNVPSFARLSRSLMLGERKKEYVAAARASGAGPVRVIARHISVNALPPLLTQLSVAFTAGILIAASLSFLGLGERPPQPSLGGLVNEARPYLRSAWWYTALPSAVLGLLLLSLTLLADAINDLVGRVSR